MKKKSKKKKNSKSLDGSITWTIIDAFERRSKEEFKQVVGFSCYCVLSNSRQYYLLFRGGSIWIHLALTNLKGWMWYLQPVSVQGTDWWQVRVNRLFLVTFWTEPDKALRCVRWLSDNNTSLQRNAGSPHIRPTYITDKSVAHGMGYADGLAACLVPSHMNFVPLKFWWHPRPYGSKMMKLRVCSGQIKTLQWLLGERKR